MVSSDNGQSLLVGADGVVLIASSATRPARRRQLRQLADAVLAASHVPNPRLRLLRDRGKVLFRVDASGHRSILRLDPQDRLPLAVLHAELAWLALLYHQARLPVPCPLPGLAPPPPAWKR